MAGVTLWHWASSGGALGSPFFAVDTAAVCGAGLVTSTTALPGSCDQLSDLAICVCGRRSAHWVGSGGALGSCL